MGTPAPSPWPPMSDLDWYAVTVEAWGGAPPWNNCGGALLATFPCCQQGANIKNWIKAQWHCSGRELCVFSGFTEQRINSVEGPYDTEERCKEAHGL